jgi:hypothetical protein
MKNVEDDIQSPGEGCCAKKYTGRQCQDPCEHDISKCFCQKECSSGRQGLSEESYKKGFGLFALGKDQFAG